MDIRDAIQSRKPFKRDNMIGAYQCLPNDNGALVIIHRDNINDFKDSVFIKDEVNCSNNTFFFNCLTIDDLVSDAWYTIEI